MSGIDVVVVHAAGDNRLSRAIDAQRGVSLTAISADAPLREVAAEARRAHGDWLWLLDGSAVPAPDALSELLRAASQSPLRPVDIVASKITTSEGRLATGHAPWYGTGITDRAMLAIAARQLPIRAARGGSLLVRAGAAAGVAPPSKTLDPAAASVEWTARILREGTGILAPRSQGTATAATSIDNEAMGVGTLSDLLASAKVLRSPAWRPSERLRLALHATGRAIRR